MGKCHVQASPVKKEKKTSKNRENILFVTFSLYFISLRPEYYNIVRMCIHLSMFLVLILVCVGFRTYTYIFYIEVLKINFML